MTTPNREIVKSSVVLNAAVGPKDRESVAPSVSAGVAATVSCLSAEGATGFVAALGL